MRTVIEHLREMNAGHPLKSGLAMKKHDNCDDFALELMVLERLICDGQATKHG
jgi:hypothetical protein